MMKNKEYLIEYEEIPNHWCISFLKLVFGIIIIFICSNNWSFMNSFMEGNVLDSIPTFLGGILVLAYLGLIVFGGLIIMWSIIELNKWDNYNRDGELLKGKTTIWGTSIKEIEEVIYPNQKKVQKQERVKYKTIFRGKND